MHLRIPLALAASAFALHGWAQQPPGPAPQEVCRAAICFVTVRVNDCATGDIEAIPDIIGIARNFNNVHIHWDLDRDSADAGFRFKSNGIAFKRANDQFVERERRPDGKKFIWKDRNTDDLTHDYAIAIARGATDCAVKDPAVANGR